MKIMKKIAAALVAAVMAITAFAVTASADSIYDTAKEITSGKENKITGVGYGSCVDYKVKVTKSGMINLNITAGFNYGSLWVYDSEGNALSYESYEMISGEMYSTDNQELYVKWNAATEKIKFKASYSVSRGTYYIRFKHAGVYDGDNKVSLTATFPSATVSKAKISYLTLKVSQGDVAELGTVLSGSGSVEWTSSKASVATVNSSGKVTAKAKGSAIITAKCGSSKQKIKIIVK